MSEISVLIGERIRACRKANGMTLQQLADRINRSKSTLSKYEAGVISVDMDTMNKNKETRNTDMKLYFGSTAATVTTLLLLGLIVFWIWAVLTRKTVEHWGLKSLFLLVFGLVVCCFAAARDGLDKTIQCAIDGSCAPGIFPLLSVPTVIGGIGAIVIILAAIATPIAKSQHAREIWFYIMSGGAAMKIVTMEIARLIAK